MTSAPQDLDEVMEEAEAVMDHAASTILFVDAVIAGSTAGDVDLDALADEIAIVPEGGDNDDDDPVP